MAVAARRDLPGDALEITDPVIVVEVLSPSTAAVDHGPKLMGDFSLPSVEHNLILDPERRVEGIVGLDLPGIQAPVAEMFPTG